jgi:hypothetical protein
VLLFRRILFIALAILSLFTAILALNHVDDLPTAEDSAFIASYLESVRINPFPGGDDYAAQLAFIRRVQSAVLESVPIFRGIPMRHTREPQDVILAKTGVCYDRSRVIEKILRYAGFRTRHTFLLSVGTLPRFMALLEPTRSTHAVTEVLTSKGWLVVDSNDPWISIDEHENPLSITAVENAHSVSWAQAPPDFYAQPFIAVYGLYSRHGQFYPPYAPGPNVNFRELLENLQG